MRLFFPLIFTSRKEVGRERNIVRERHGLVASHTRIELATQVSALDQESNTRPFQCIDQRSTTEPRWSGLHCFSYDNFHLFPVFVSLLLVESHFTTLKLQRTEMISKAFSLWFHNFNLIILCATSI